MFERKRISLNGAEMGRRCGVNANTQSIYENGHRLPDAGYLTLVDALGADVLYILTGRRQPDLGAGDTGRQLQAIINLWPRLSPTARASLAALLEALAGEAKEP